MDPTLRGVVWSTPSVWAGEGDKEEVMPQLDLSIYLSQTTWLIVIFLIYYLTFKGLILPVILEKLFIRKNLLSSKADVQTKEKQIKNYSL